MGRAYQDPGVSTVIAVVLLIALTLVAVCGAGFVFSNYVSLKTPVNSLLSVSVHQYDDENRIEVELEHRGGDVLDARNITVMLRGEDEDGKLVLLDSEADNVTKVTPDSSQLVQVGERMRVTFENGKLKTESGIEVTVVYNRSHVIFKSSATLQPGITLLPPILILSLTDPDIDVIETVWRPRLGENEYPRILGHNIDNILAAVTVELGDSTGRVTLLDNEVLDLVYLMKRMSENSFNLQAGFYDRIRVEISEVRLVTDNGEILEPLIEETALEFPIYLRLVAGKRHELRIDIDAPASLRFTRENGLVWNTRVRIAHRAVDDEWSEVVVKGEENVVRIVDGEVVENYPVTPVVPPLDVSCSTHYALIGQEVEFSFEPREDVVEVSWDFDDGDNSIELSPRHAFAEPGGHEVRVRAEYPDNTIREGRVALAVTHSAPAVQDEDVPPPAVPGLLTDVSQFTGQPAVQVPLKVPPGRRIEPSLSLVYGGGGFNQVLGAGWGLEGLGSVERDTHEGAPSYDNSDKFLINRGGSTQELVSLGEPSYPAQEFTWTVTGTGEERVRENGVIYPEILFDWEVHAQGIERGMYREEFPDVPFNWTVEGRADESWEETVCDVDPQQSFNWTVTGTGTEVWTTYEYRYSGYICYWCFGSDSWECPHHSGWNVVGMTRVPYPGADCDWSCCCPTGLYDSPRLVSSCDGTTTYYCTYRRGAEHTATRTNGDSGSGTVNLFEGAKDVGTFSATPQPQQGGSIVSTIYTIGYNNPNLNIYFSNTGTTTTADPNAHVIVAPAEGIVHEETLTEEVTGSCSGSATVNMRENWKDVGGFSITLQPQHGGTLSAPSYTMSCDEPRVQVRFSDTQVNETSNADAHVQAKTDYYEFKWYPNDYTATENDSSGHAAVNALSENDLGNVMPLLMPQHEGTIENVTYMASCDDFRVALHFSGTDANQTSNSSAHLIANTDYSISTLVPENKVQVSASCSGSGSVNTSDDTKDLGGFDATPEPRYGGEVENVVYAITCDNPNVEVYFSGTGTCTTTDPSAHVMAETDYQETTPVAEYRSKHTNDFRVKFNGEYWEVWDTSGTRYTFGASPNSRVTNASGTFKWLLDRVTDAHGNYMIVSYTQDGGYAYPASIEYTGHEGTGELPWVGITFVYEERPDSITSYRTGSALVMSKRLAKIEMKVEGELVRTYELNYSLSPATQRSLLASVTERAGNGEVLPPVTFEYSQGTWAFDGKTTEEDFWCEWVRNGDFDEGWNHWSHWASNANTSADGVATFSCLANPGEYRNWSGGFEQTLGTIEAGSKVELNYIWYMYRTGGGTGGGGDGSCTVKVKLVKPDGQEVVVNHYNSSDYWGPDYVWGPDHVFEDVSSYFFDQTGTYRIRVEMDGYAYGDPGGHGKYSYIYVEAGFSKISLEVSEPGEFKVSEGYPLFRSDLDGDARADLFTIMLSGDWVARINGETSKWLELRALHGESLLFGDFNGDGKLDAGVYSTQGLIRVVLSSGESFYTPLYWSTGLGDSQGKLVTGDFNGDGKTDVLAVEADGFKVALSAGDRFISAKPWLQGVDTSGLEVLTADFNADGLTDAVLVDKSLGTWKVALSTGKIFTSPAVWISGFCPNLDVAAMDLNRDGLADAVALDSGELKFARSTGGSFASPQVFTSGLDRMPTLADFNADGLLDLSVFDPETCIHRVTYATGEPADVLVKARNELGGKISYTYAPSSSFVDVKLPRVIPVVSEMVRDDGVGTPSATTYTYSDGKFEVGQGFMGFGESSATLAGSTTTTRFHLETFRRGLVYEIEVKDGSGNLYSKRYTTWDVGEPISGIRVPRMTREDAYTYDGDESYRLSTTLYEYDSYGNLVRVEELGDFAMEGDERTTCIEYTYNLERWVMLSSHTYVLDASGAKVSETWYYYDGATSYTSSPVKGGLTKQESWLNTGDNPVTIMSHDAYGNLVNTTDARGNTTTIEYDSTHHIFPVKVTNALGYVQTLTYDLMTGQLLSQTDFNGVTVSYEFDEFGRPTKTIAPGDSPASPTKSFTYDLSSDPVKTVVQTRSMQGIDQVSSTYVFFDAFGRVIQTRQQAEDVSQQVVRCVNFNSLGKVEHEWLPYFTPVSSSYGSPDPSKPKVRHEYDIMGRVIKMTYPDGASVTAAHSDWTITTTDAKGNSIRKTYDAHGQLIKIEEFNGSNVYITTYSHDAMGNLVQIVDAKDNVTLMTYDSLGRRTSLKDPDMGEWLYWYDANGNLEAERDANGEVIHYCYDGLNRLLKKDYPSGIDVEYQYDGSTIPYSTGRRTQVIDASGTTTSYYDELGREIMTVKRIDGTDYAVERSFDSTGRVTSVKYPDGEVVFYAYNPAGGIEAVVGSCIYVRRVDYDAQGRITSIEYGNGVRTTQTYDALRLRTLQTNDGAFQDLSYGYDAAGNIIKLVDHLHEMEQTFGYDDLNRLTYAAGSYGTQHYAYDEIGNLIEKDGINYEYGQGDKHPHAVTAGSDGFAAIYDANGNMTWRRDHNGESFYSYDFEDRLTRVERGGQTLAEFIYDGGGGRVKKITPQASRIYIGNLYEMDNWGWKAKHIFLGKQRVATIEGGSTHFYHPDHLGSASVVTDEYGNLIQLIEYDPFGSIVVSSGSGDIKYKFMGKESDDETGLVYFGARYYDPMLGRFITADPLVQSLEDPQLLNRYTFCRNNPLIFQEAQGNFFWAVVAIVCIAITVASFVSPSFNAWMSETFGEFAGPIIAAAAVVATFAVAGPMLGVQSAGATIGEAVTAAKVPAMAAAASTAVLNTGEGRQFISWLANEVFDDAFGMSPKVAYVTASVVAHAGTSCVFESMFTTMFAPKGSLKRAGEAPQTEVEEFTKTHPGGTAGGRPYVEPDISKLGERPGKWTRLANESGEVAAYHWSGPIWDVPILRHVVKHHQFYAPGMSQGFVPASWSYGTFGVCQQLTPKGYSSSIISLGLADPGVYVTSLIYGQYGGGLFTRVYWAQQAANR